MAKTRVAIKVDVDTLVGYREGVPRLLELFDRFGITASIFFALGPDNSGKAIRRIFRKGFLAKMFRTNVAATYGIKTLLYGTILPAPQIAESNPDTIRAAIRAGHDVGIHCYDHVRWQDELDVMGEAEIHREFSRAYDLFARLTGFRAQSCAAPGWQANRTSLLVQDAFNLLYCSDTRGVYPFIPMCDGRVFSTLQIPTTWPTFDELYGANGITDATINAYYLNLLKAGHLTVHTVHAEIEGMGKAAVFADLLTQLKAQGVEFVTLRDVATELLSDRASLPVCTVVPRPIPGRAGCVATQMD